MQIKKMNLKDFGYHGDYPIQTVGNVKSKPYVLVSGSRLGGEQVNIDILNNFLDYTLLCGGALGIDTRAIEYFLVKKTSCGGYGSSAI